MAKTLFAKISMLCYPSRATTSQCWKHAVWPGIGLQSQKDCSKADSLTRISGGTRLPTCTRILNLYGKCHRLATSTELMARGNSTPAAQIPWRNVGIGGIKTGSSPLKHCDYPAHPQSLNFSIRTKRQSGKVANRTCQSQCHCPTSNWAAPE